MAIGSRAKSRGDHGRPPRGNFTSQDSDTVLRTFRADSSSPQISATLVGHFTGTHDSLCSSPKNFTKFHCTDKCQDPGSRNSLSRSHVIGGLSPPQP